MGICKKVSRRKIAQFKDVHTIEQFQIGIRENEELFEIITQKQSIEFMEHWMEKNLFP